MENQYQKRRLKLNTKILPKLETKVNKKDCVKMDFQGGQITSDGGLILLKKLDDNLELTENINNLIKDPRDSRKLIHTQKQLLSQRLYQIIAGYEDCNDCNLLRNDPTLKLLAGKRQNDEALGSQPTVSRLENRITRYQISRLKRLFTEQYTGHIPPKKDQSLILDCDSTEDPTHGEQQLTLFSGLFDKKCYHPFLVFEAHSQALLGVHLRPGSWHPARNAHRVLLPIITKLKRKWPKKQIIIRGDSSLGSLKMSNFCSNQECDYIFAVGNLHNRFGKHIESLIQKAKEQYEKIQKECTIYSSFWYSSRLWKRPARIRVQIKVNFESVSQRFLLTNLKGPTKKLYGLYNQRGQCENYIKELKLGLNADRLSCHSFKANFFRLLLHCFAYQMIVLFRQLMRDVPDIAKAQIDTLRLKLFKIGAVVYQRARWTWIRFSSSWPFRNIFFKVAKKLGFTTSFT